MKTIRQLQQSKHAGRIQIASNLLENASRTSNRPPAIAFGGSPGKSVEIVSFKCFVSSYL